jgi:DNA-binding CsgD family transcriptional regulator
MTADFQNLMTRLHGARGKEDLSAAISGFLAGYGLTTFAYLGFSRGSAGPPVYVSTYPEGWIRHYENRRYQEIDPVVLRARSSVLPFYWSSVPDAQTSDEQRRFYGEATEFGIRCGFLVPIHDTQGDTALVSFASDARPEVLSRTIEQHKPVIHMAAIYFHAYARQRLAHPLELARPQLTPREIACLQWIARGKTSYDIADILSVSRRTVVFHLENAKVKLNAVTLPQAVANALQNRLIEF